MPPFVTRLLQMPVTPANSMGMPRAFGVSAARAWAAEAAMASAEQSMAPAMVRGSRRRLCVSSKLVVNFATPGRLQACSSAFSLGVGPGRLRACNSAFSFEVGRFRHGRGRG